MRTHTIGGFVFSTRLANAIVQYVDDLDPPIVSFEDAVARITRDQVLAIDPVKFGEVKNIGRGSVEEFMRVTGRKP